MLNGHLARKGWHRAARDNKAIPFWRWEWETRDSGHWLILGTHEKQIQSSAKEETGSQFGYCNFPTGWCTHKKALEYLYNDTLTFWLPFSPDLSLQDFVIWGYLNKTIYANNLEALKTNISGEVKNIPVDMIARVIANFIIWEAAVIQKQGAWKEHAINY